jgi:predicted Fe-S protein YdhL (DUF1289 family)
MGTKHNFKNREICVASPFFCTAIEYGLTIQICRVMNTDLPPGAPELASPVPSPCVSLCKMNRDTGFCEGCLRTIDEIVAWSGADDAFKRAVWAEIRRREQLIDFE